MKLIKEWDSMDDTMRHLKHQVVDSLAYCKKRFSGYSPSDLFFYLKSITTYVDDPDDDEHFQSVKTLFDRNIHGISGAGDCDCFTILSLACMVVNDIRPQFIVLAGNDKHIPVHIFAACTDDIIPFDLTEGYLGQKRRYKYYQTEPFCV